jgi:hypothetical protein
MIFRSFMLDSMRLKFIAVTGLCIIVVVSWSLATTACEVLLGWKLPISMGYDSPLTNRALKGTVST